MAKIAATSCPTLDNFKTDAIDDMRMSCYGSADCWLNLPVTGEVGQWRFHSAI